jgi:2-iminobutanoate/2-iminopropanoate deaminase
LGVTGTPRLLVSGQVGVDRTTGRLVQGGTVAQAEAALHNLLRIVEASGRTESDVLRVQLYLTDMDDLPAVNELYARTFSAPYPARTTIGVAALPGGASFEVDAVVG